MDKKCLGCGITLQNSEKDALGYTPDLNKDYCMRCFRIKHYNDLSKDSRYFFNNDQSLTIMKNRNTLLVYVLDILSFSAFLNINPLKQYKNNDVILIINKIDLLPKNTNFKKIEKRIVAEIKKLNLDNIDLKAVLLTRKNDSDFKELFDYELNNGNYNNIVFIGSFNAGKSTLINNLLENNRLTTSKLPGTTVAYNKIKYGKYDIYDSPGSGDPHNFLMNIPFSLLPSFVSTKTIKPRIYQLSKNQSFLIDQVFRLDLKINQRTSVIFYIDSGINIKHTALIKDEITAEDKIKLTNFRYDNICKKDFEIDGLGFITLFNIAEANFYLPEQTAIYQREVLL